MKYWLQYSKGGNLRFIGHLDMLHSWERILRRARVPLAFSQGYSPHPLLSLAAPLPVGLISQAEYLELVTTEAVPNLTEMIAVAVPSDIRVAGAVAVPDKTKPLMGLIRYADYLVEGIAEGQRAQLEKTLADFLGQTSVIRTVRRKSGMKKVDIRPLVHFAHLQGTTLRLRLSIGSVANLRVEDLLQHLDLIPSSLQIAREQLYLDVDGKAVTPFQYAAATGTALEG
jgi:radical SAM-linked protein